jgi:Cu+-exporting ATPase
MDAPADARDHGESYGHHGHAMHSEHAMHADHAMRGEHAGHDEHEGGAYTCPMHPEVRQPGPGRCPKCGMDLVPDPEHHPA